MRVELPPEVRIVEDERVPKGEMWLWLNGRCIARFVGVLEGRVMQGDWFTPPLLPDEGEGEGERQNAR